MKGGDTISGKIKVNTAKLQGNKAEIEAERKQFEAQLDSCLNIIELLNSSWTGSVYDAMLSSYKISDKQMFREPVNAIKKVEKYLGEQVISGYDKVENANIDLSKVFK